MQLHLVVVLQIWLMGGRPGELWTLQSGPATNATDGVFQATLHSPEAPSKWLNFKCGWSGGINYFNY